MAQVIHQWSVTPAPCNCIFCKLSSDLHKDHQDAAPIQFRLAEDLQNHRFLVEELGTDAVGQPAWRSVSKDRAAVALAESVKQLISPKSPIEVQLSQETQP